MHMTPTANAGLPQRRADFDSLADALDYAAQGHTGLNFFNSRGQLTAALPYRDLRVRAQDLARRLAGLGLPREARVVIVAETDADFVAVFFACQYAGLLPVPVALPVGLGGKDAYIGQLRRQIETSGASIALGPASLAGFLTEAAAGLGLVLIGSAADVAALPESQAPLRPLAAGERCYLQYSSGSTRFPLGVDITQRALMANMHGVVVDGLDVNEQDRASSWLPLYHDMGLIGFVLAPVVSQRSCDLMPTREFARRPLQWLTLIGKHRATLTYSPSFGFDLCARAAAKGSLEGLDLRFWRSAGIGGDMIQPAILRRFAETFAPVGFDARALFPSYGMAETCVALTMVKHGTGLTIDKISRKGLADGRAQPGAPGDDERELASCGPPMPGHQIEIRGEDGKKLADRQVGRIFAKGPSIMPGYFNAPEASAAVLVGGGWLDTGDLGYTIAGSVVVTGRAKDLIIVNGRNIWPQDLEWGIETIAGLRRGDAAAFSLDDETAHSTGAETVVVLVQCRLGEVAARQALKRDVAAKVREIAAIDCQVALIPPKGLPQTSSGKLSRARAKTNYLAGQYANADPIG